MHEFNYEFYKESADYLQKQIDRHEFPLPETAIILGSGLNKLTEKLEDPISIPYKDVPNILVSTNPSHEGRYVFGRLKTIPILLLSGRIHYYEGYDFDELAQPVRVLAALGIKRLIITNAAGSVNKNYQVGEIMIINDHIDLAGVTPLRGPNIEEFGPRFPDMTDLYCRHLKAIAWDAAGIIGSRGFCEGVYCFMPGPHYETKAQVRALSVLGADAVGMSTVPEAITACHCGLEVLGLSLLSNMAAGVIEGKLSDDEVIAAGHRASEKFGRFIEEILIQIELEKNANFLAEIAEKKETPAGTPIETVAEAGTPIETVDEAVTSIETAAEAAAPIETAAQTAASLETAAADLIATSDSVLNDASAGGLTAASDNILKGARDETGEGSSEQKEDDLTTAAQEIKCEENAEHSLDFSMLNLNTEDSVAPEKTDTLTYAVTAGNKTGITAPDSPPEAAKDHEAHIELSIDEAMSSAIDVEEKDETPADEFKPGGLEDFKTTSLDDAMTKGLDQDFDDLTGSIFDD